MKYYVLKINNKIVRHFHFENENTEIGDGMYIDPWYLVCEFTDDLNLAFKFSEEELSNRHGYVSDIKNYFQGEDFVNDYEIVKNYSFEEIHL